MGRQGETPARRGPYPGWLVRLSSAGSVPDAQAGDRSRAFLSGGGGVIDEEVSASGFEDRVVGGVLILEHLLPVEEALHAPAVPVALQPDAVLPPGLEAAADPDVVELELAVVDVEAPVAGPVLEVDDLLPGGVPLKRSATSTV